MAASLALILHAHLPFVRHPEQEFCAEERWLFEALTETYVPLLRMLQRLRDDAVPFRITLSVSPTLGAMLANELLVKRYLRHLDQLTALAECECARHRDHAALRPLAHWYRDFFAETRRVFVEDWRCDLAGVIRRLCHEESVELIASAATHAVLPIFQQHASAARAQIAIGCDFFRHTFGHDPAGFWLPECAYGPGIDELLQQENIRWFVVDSHALELASPPARAGTLAPCFTPAGPAAFARDARASRQIWDASCGYPGDSSYRDFYSDIGFALSAGELAPLDHAQGQFTGIKYHRVTAGEGEKKIYSPSIATETARHHAAHFIEQCLATLNKAETGEPILAAPFDAELFGHWWFEGPAFLEQVIRAAAERHLLLSTPTDYLRGNPALQIVEPIASSWGEGGFLDVWLADKCAWIYPQLFAAVERMAALADRHARDATPAEERVLRALARELVLAQASDWPFHIRNGTAAEYASERVRSHLARFDQLAVILQNGNCEAELEECETRDNVLAEIEWRHFSHRRPKCSGPAA